MHIKLTYLTLLIFSSLLFVSCERDFETDIINKTPPSLEVFVRTASATPITGATVKLYKDEATWNAEGAAAATKNTNAEGRVVFTTEELQNPGFYYLITSEGAKKVKTKTKYLLLTDGSTLLTVTLN